jgi:glycosyltransferase involved in cell wall biosynthesis
MNKVLIITYYWPPSGGAGVQRWLKFSKYLPESGWEPVILTIDPENAAYPVIDDSLISEVSSSVRVYKTPVTDYFRIYKKDRTKIPSAGFANNLDNSLKGKVFRFIRGNFFIPDPRRGWNKFAFKKACEIIENETIAHIITTSPPHSTQLIGLKLKKIFPLLNWHCDLRDPWTDIYYYKKFYPTLFSKSIDLYYERNVLRKADSVTVTSLTQKELYESKAPSASNKIFVVPNGYDETDFEGIKKTVDDICSITYIGTISDVYPLEGLLQAIKNLKETGSIIELRFTGLVTENQKLHILDMLGSQYAIFNDYAEHREAIKMMVNSTFLLLIIPDVAGNIGVIPGKLFEYLATGNPIICLGPLKTDVAEIIRSMDAGGIFGYDDSSSIEEFILQKIKNHHVHISNQINILKYSRRNLTREIIKILES